MKVNIDAIRTLATVNFEIIKYAYQDANAIVDCAMQAMNYYSFNRIVAEENFPDMAVRRMKHILFLNTCARKEGFPFITEKLTVNEHEAKMLAFDLADAINTVRREFEEAREEEKKIRKAQ